MTLPLTPEDPNMISPEKTIAVEAFRKAFERADALGINVKALTPTLPGPPPGQGYVIRMKDLMFVKRYVPTPFITEVHPAPVPDSVP